MIIPELHYYSIHSSYNGFFALLSSRVLPVCADFLWRKWVRIKSWLQIHTKLSGHAIVLLLFLSSAPDNCQVLKDHCALTLVSSALSFSVLQPCFYCGWHKHRGGDGGRLWCGERGLKVAIWQYCRALKCNQKSRPRCSALCAVTLWRASPLVGFTVRSPNKVAFRTTNTIE